MIHFIHKWIYHFQTIGTREYQLRTCEKCGKTMVLDDGGVWAVVTDVKG